MSISSIQNTIDRYRKEINDFSTKIATLRKRKVEAEAKAAKAIADARKSKSSSTIKSKMADADRHSKEAARQEKDLATLEKQRAAREKNLLDEEKKLNKAKAEEEKKQAKEREKIDTSHESKIRSLTRTVNYVKLEQERLSKVYPLLSVAPDEAYDVFISHASEDKASFVDALVDALVKRGVKVWYDRNVLTWGKSIRYNIDNGLQQSKYAIVVLSEFYINKYWTQKEFNALFALGSKYEGFILPIWHNISAEMAKQFSPMLSDSIAIKSSDFSVAEIANQFVEILNYTNSNE